MSAWLSTGAAADRLGIAERTLTSWCRRGTVPATACRQPAGYAGRWLIATWWVNDAENAENAEALTGTSEHASMST